MANLHKNGNGIKLLSDEQELLTVTSNGEFIQPLSLPQDNEPPDLSDVENVEPSTDGDEAYDSDFDVLLMSDSDDLRSEDVIDFCTAQMNDPDVTKIAKYINQFMHIQPRRIDPYIDIRDSPISNFGERNYVPMVGSRYTVTSYFNSEPMTLDYGGFKVPSNLTDRMWCALKDLAYFDTVNGVLLMDFLDPWVRKKYLEMAYEWRPFMFDSPSFWTFAQWFIRYQNCSDIPMNMPFCLMLDHPIVQDKIARLPVEERFSRNSVQAWERREEVIEMFLEGMREIYSKMELNVKTMFAYTFYETPIMEALMVKKHGFKSARKTVEFRGAGLPPTGLLYSALSYFNEIYSLFVILQMFLILGFAIAYCPIIRVNEPFYEVTAPLVHYTLYGGGEQDKGKNNSKRPISTNSTVVRKQTGFQDQVTDKDRWATLVHRSMKRTNGHVPVKGFHFVAAWRDPIFKYYDASNPNKKLERFTKIVYPVFDPNAPGEIREVPKGDATCLFDCALALYLGTLILKTFDEYCEAIDCFNQHLLRVTEERHKAADITYLQFLDGTGLPSSDWLDPLCNALNIRIALLGASLPEHVGIQGTTIINVYGAIHVCKGRRYVNGVAGLIYHMREPSAHFSLAVGLQCEARAQLDQYVDGVPYRPTDLLACFVEPDMTKATPYYGFTMWSEREIPASIVLGGVRPDTVELHGKRVAPRTKTTMTTETQFDKIQNRVLMDHSIHIRFCSKSWRITVPVDYDVEDVLKAIPETIPELKFVDFVCHTKKDVPIQKLTTLNLFSKKANAEEETYRESPALDPPPKVVDQPKEDVGDVGREKIEDSSSDEDSEAEPEAEGDGPKIVFVGIRELQGIKLTYTLEDVFLMHDSETDFHTRVVNEINTLYSDRTDIMDLAARSLGYSWKLNYLNGQPTIVTEPEDDKSFVPSGKTLGDLATSSHRLWIRGVENHTEDPGGVDPNLTYVVEPDSYSDKKLVNLGATVYWKRKRPPLLLNQKREGINSLISSFISLFHGRLAANVFESSLALMMIQRLPDGIFGNLFEKIKLFQVAVNTNSNIDWFLKVIASNRDQYGQCILEYNPEFCRAMPGLKYATRKIENTLTWKYVRTYRADDVYHYARPVNQLEDILHIAVARKVEYKPFEVNTQEGLDELLWELISGSNTFDVPRFYNETITRGPDAGRNVMRQVVKQVTWREMTLIEQIMFLGVFSSGFKQVVSSSYIALNVMSELSSPKVLVGCTDYDSVDQRVNANSANALAKFHFRNFLRYVDIDVPLNTVEAAKCIGYSYIEKVNGTQATKDFEKGSVMDTHLSSPFVKTKNTLPMAVLFGAGLFNNKAYNIIGYESTEHNLSKPGKVVKNFRIGNTRESEEYGKYVACTNYNVEGCLAPIPNLNSTSNITEGLIKRIGYAVPEPNTATKVCFPPFVKWWCKHYDLKGAISQLLIEEVKQMENWDEYTKTLRYSPARLRQLTKVRREVEVLGTFQFSNDEEGRWLERQWTMVEAHVKWESYNNEYKYIRMIFARMDHFKVFFGPHSKLIQKALYMKLPHFVTNRPVRTLAYFIWSTLSIFTLIFSTDFSGFESHNYPWLMHNCVDTIVYTMYNGQLTSEIVYMLDKLTQRNDIVNKFVSCKIDAKMMSGETLTSIFNSLTNVLKISFIVEIEGLVYGTGFFHVGPKSYRCWFAGKRTPDGGMELVIYVAGDDGIFGLPELPWVDYEKFADGDYLAKYGVKLKISKQTSIAGAGFLSKYYSDFDFVTLCDPFKQLSKGILSPKYAKTSVGVKKGLARMRAMSLKYEFGSCPVVGAYADAILRCTRNVMIKKALVYLQQDDPFKSEYYAEVALWYDEEVKGKYDEPRKIGMDSRLVIEDNFGIPISTQEVIEKYFDSVDTTAYPVEFVVPCFDLLVGDVNKDFYYNYCVEQNGLVCGNGLSPIRKTVDPEFVETDWFDFIQRNTCYVPMYDSLGGLRPTYATYDDYIASAA